MFPPVFQEQDRSFPHACAQPTWHLLLAVPGRAAAGVARLGWAIGSGPVWVLWVM